MVKMSKTEETVKTAKTEKMVKVSKKEETVKTVKQHKVIAENIWINAFKTN